MGFSLLEFLILLYIIPYVLVTTYSVAPSIVHIIFNTSYILISWLTGCWAWVIYWVPLLVWLFNYLMFEFISFISYNTSYHIYKDWLSIYFNLVRVYIYCYKRIKKRKKRLKNRLQSHRARTTVDRIIPIYIFAAKKEISNSHKSNHC